MDTAGEQRMTIGALAKRTGVSIRLLREYDRLGLLYTMGRSQGNYRLFDDTATWCVRQINAARALGLTLKEVGELCAYRERHPAAPIGPQLRKMLRHALARVDERVADLLAVRGRILGLESALPAAEHTAAQVDGHTLFVPGDPDSRRGDTRRPGVPAAGSSG